jgi:hypothetical protein
VELQRPIHTNNTGMYHTAAQLVVLVQAGVVCWHPLSANEWCAPTKPTRPMTNIDNTRPAAVWRCVEPHLLLHTTLAYATAVRRRTRSWMWASQDERVGEQGQVLHSKEDGKCEHGEQQVRGHQHARHCPQTQPPQRSSVASSTLRSPPPRPLPRCAATWSSASSACLTWPPWTCAVKAPPITTLPFSPLI